MLGSYVSAAIYCRANPYTSFYCPVETSVQSGVKFFCTMPKKKHECLTQCSHLTSLGRCVYVRVRNLDDMDSLTFIDFKTSKSVVLYTSTSFSKLA